MDETKLTADLPTMNVEIVHRATPDGRGEMVTIQLNATPDFRTALPLVAGMAQLPLMLAQSAPSSPLDVWASSPLALWSKGPLAAWSQAAQAMMAPWAALAATNPFLALLQGPDTAKRD